MDEKTAAVMNPKYPRKLDLNAPLLSTRRPAGLELCHANSRGALCDTRDRVPFSWEQSPGKPKETGACDAVETPVPPPRPPPGRQLPLREVTRNGDDYDGDNDNEDGSFSDAMDTFSLSAAIDMVELQERERHKKMLGGISIEPSNYGSESPSFIIQRFLSDAKALAISSGLPIPKNINKSRGVLSGPDKCIPQTVMKSPKGCGLEVFFPWRMKQKACGIKRPVRATSTRVKRQWGMRDKWKSSSAESSSRSDV